MPELIRLTSATAVILAGIIILILWIAAANDKGAKDGDEYKCHGLNFIYHDAIAKNYYVDKKSYTSDFNSWVKGNKDAYPALIAFGVIIGLLWVITGAIGFMVKNHVMAKLYLGLGVITYLLFVVMFPIILQRIMFVLKEGSGQWSVNKCKTKDDWPEKHGEDSFNQFWGAALVGFILGAYQIAGAIYVYNTMAVEGEIKPPTS